jgi:lipopolysaccharide biosynthesis regulator YciM
MSIAMEHYHNDRMEQAREKFSEVIRIDPNLRQPWFTLATIHEARNEMDKALSFKIVGTHLSSLKSSARDWADLGSESRQA